MNAEKFVTAIEKFFLDVIGSIIPGLALLAGIWAVFGPVQLGTMALAVPTTDTTWTLTIMVGYVLGHALTSLGEKFVVPLAARFGNLGFLERFFADFAEDDASVMLIQSSPAVAVLAEKSYGKPATPSTATEMRRLRSTAMTIASDHTATINRFTFISLLCLGIATALWITAIMVIIQAVVLAWGKSGVTAGLLTAGCGMLIAAGMVVVSLIFMERRFIFYRRTMFTPFDMAVGVLAKGEKKEKTPEAAPAPHTAPAVYLAGSASGWQDRVITGVPGARYLDARRHGLADARAATSWRLAALAASDVVFANLEPAEPGYVLAMEMGYAKGLGKHVILVDEKTAADPVLAPALKPLLELAHAPFPTLDEGMVYLRERLSLM